MGHLETKNGGVKMKTKLIARILIVITIFLLVLLACFSLIKYKNPSFDFITYLSGSSSFIIVIVTVLYVYTTSKQLEVMHNQLLEMKTERELQGQPLLCLNDIRISIKQPGYSYSYCVSQSYTSVYTLKAELKNIADAPAVCVDLSASIEIKNEDVVSYLDSPSLRFDSIESKSRISENELLVYVDDTKGLLFEALRQKDLTFSPTLIVKILYRNITGGYFLYSNQYHIIMGIENEEIMKNWHTKIVSFPVKYKDRVEKIDNYFEKDMDKWELEAGKLKTEIESESDKHKDVDLYLCPIPSEYSIRKITLNEYSKLTENIKYGKQFNKTTICR